jgi:hypothetical protein
MAGAQQMRRLDKGLSRKERQGVGPDLDDAPAFEHADRDVVAGEPAIGCIIAAEREELMVGSIAHSSLRYAIPSHKRRLRICVKSASRNTLANRKKKLS